jgi:outer membrane scaffolding protein for murein synthesis (MipA/OmpV family)
MKRVLRLLFFFLIAVLFTPLIATGADKAELEELMDMTEEIDEAPGYEDPKDAKRNWALSIGVIGGVKPEYEGSDEYEFGIGPNLAGSWRDILFFKGKTIGVNLIRKKNLKAGPILSWTGGRDEDDNDKLEGLGDVDSSIEAGGFVSYRKKPLRFKMEARHDINSGHEGGLVELSAGTTLPFNKPRVFVALGTTWASDDYMESFFGVDSNQSADSGLKKYNAESGIKDINLSVSAGYSITNRWRLGGKVEYKRLVGDAADSPIVEDENQFLAGIGISYHMGSKILPEDLKE